MKPRRSTADDRGYTLIELLAYAFVLAIIVNMSVTLFLNAKRLSNLGEMAFERISGVDEIGREFTDAVLQSDAIVNELNGIVTDEECLVLSQPAIPFSGAGGPPAEVGRRYVVFRAVREGQYLRAEEYLEDGEGLSLEKLKTFALPIAGLRFEYGSERPEQSRTVRLHLHIDSGGTPNTTPSENVFVASLRGWRG